MKRDKNKKWSKEDPYKAGNKKRPILWFKYDKDSLVIYDSYGRHYGKQVALDLIKAGLAEAGPNLLEELNNVKRGAVD